MAAFPIEGMASFLLARMVAIAPAPHAGRGIEHTAAVDEVNEVLSLLSL
jgi:hypothetical protein